MHSRNKPIIERINNRRRHACASQHRQKRVIDSMTVRQTKGDIRRAASGVHTQLITQAMQHLEYVFACTINRANRHNQRVNDNVFRLNAIIGRAVYDAFSHFKSDIRVLGNARTSSAVVEFRSGRPL